MINHWYISVQIGAQSPSTLVLYGLVLTAIAIYAQILRDINAELIGR